MSGRKPPASWTFRWPHPDPARGRHGPAGLDVATMAGTRSVQWLSGLVGAVSGDRRRRPGGVAVSLQRMLRGHRQSQRSTSGCDFETRSRLDPCSNFSSPRRRGRYPRSPEEGTGRVGEAGLRALPDLRAVQRGALVLAEKIVSSLEIYVERMSDHLRTGGDRHALTAGNWVMDNIHQQLRNLTDIRGRIDSWRWHLQVLDGRPATSCVSCWTTNCPHCPTSSTGSACRCVRPAC